MGSIPCSSLEKDKSFSDRENKVYADEVPDDLPELGADLVAALAGLHMHNLPHGGGKDGPKSERRDMIV